MENTTEDKPKMPDFSHLPYKEQLKAAHDWKVEEYKKNLAQVLKDSNQTEEGLKQAVCNFVAENASELYKEFQAISCHGNYAKMLYGEEIIPFLLSDCTKTENWKIVSFTNSEDKPLLGVYLNCTAIDDGEALTGEVIFNRQGVIRHAFANGDR